MKRISRARRWSGSHWATFTLFTVLIGSVPGSLGAIHPNHPLDVDPEKKVQGFAEGVDRIDLYSGALSLGIPIGPFQLNYSSSVWRYKRDDVGEIISFPQRLNNAGLGFHLGWGEVMSPSFSLNQTDKWLYVGSDGGEHVFYPTLHKGEAAEAGVFYSRDNSYLRLRVQDDNTGIHVWTEIEFPDGRTQRFECVPPPGEGCGLGSLYRLKKEWSPFASRENPDFEVQYSNFNMDGRPELWTLINRYGLTHKIHLKGDAPFLFLQVTKVEVQASVGQTATYEFEYKTTNIHRSCKDSSNETGPSISVPLLTRIDLPDGSNYRMTIGESEEPTYHTTCEAGIDDVSGVIWGLFLPTGGGVAWEWQENEFPPGDNHSEFNTSAGVKARLLADADINILGRWTYKSTSIGRGDPWETSEDDPQIITEVGYPTGDCSKHYFNARYWPTPSQGLGWELGLPFVYTEQSDGKFLSTELWDSTDGAGGCNTSTGTKIRSTYLRYRRDAPPGQAPGPGNNLTMADFYNTNRQVEASRTVFHLDTLDSAGQERYADVKKSQFDGLGHFRSIVETGNFRDDSATEERREAFVGFDRSTGVYPGTYVPVPSTTPWVLDVFSKTLETEPDANGVQTSKIEVEFDDATGFLRCTRLLVNGSSRGPTDILTTRSHDSLGRLTEIKQYGGDLYPGHDTPLPTSGGDCGTLPAQPDYWLTFGYDPLSGAQVSSRPLTPSGGLGPFLTYDVDVEAKTGVVLRERDPAGAEVAYSYDAMGRLISARPEQDAQLLYTYNLRTPTTPASVTTRVIGQGTGEIFSERQILLDDVGRPTLERRRLPGANVWSERETERNARGWVTSVSEWGDVNQKTEFLDFDALGRPGIIRPPEGAIHDIRLSHRGARQVTRQVRRALGGGEVYTLKVARSDRYGRLFEVKEPSGSGGSMTTSRHLYDVASRLTELRTETSGFGNRPGIRGGASALSQVRSFQYDARGFLLSETHPEKGVSGNGTVTYHDFDASGQPHRMVDGPHSLGSVYDFMRRPIELHDLNRPPAEQLLTKFVWDGAPGEGAGKLWTADQYNYVDLAWNSEGEELVQIQQKFKYEGARGAISDKVTSVYWSSENVKFKQAFTYDDFGSLETMTYPYCVQPAACASSEAGTSRTISYSRERDFLTAVSQVEGSGSIPWAGPITYFPGGLRKALPHANGVTDHIEADSHRTGRVGRMFTSGTVEPGFDSGDLSYDGAGNIMAMERQVDPSTTVTNTFSYDGVGRLTEASYLDGSFGPAFTYDAFGNLQGVTGLNGGMTLLATTSATNRLKGATYDGAGNLLSTPVIPWPFTYNPENRLAGQAGHSYLYDAFGERAMRVSTLPFAGAAFHLRDLDNRLVTDATVSQGMYKRQRDFIFAGDVLLASSGPSTHDRHYHLDHLGSTRLVTASDGSVENTFFHFPYGGHGGLPEQEFRFAGHEQRDHSTGADYMHARHYRSDIGRFVSVDPLPGKAGEPQSWNRYAYALGNPLNLIDPSGEQAICDNGELGEADVGVCHGNPVPFYFEAEFDPPFFVESPLVLDHSIPGSDCFTASCSGRGGDSLLPSGSFDLPAILDGISDTATVIGGTIANNVGANEALKAAGKAQHAADAIREIALPNSFKRLANPLSTGAEANAAFHEVQSNYSNIADQIKTKAKSLQNAKAFKYGARIGWGIAAASLVIDGWAYYETWGTQKAIRGSANDAAVTTRANAVQAQARARAAAAGAGGGN
ncbi:MAG: RHS repeat-associated core domain-containing protein [Deltaproteobacteria bacterium]|nr:RHS repeat-associated core domain-containing protein [Deltaproteobacteria bacterium]